MIKKTILILDGIIAKKFLDNICKNYFNKNQYAVISQNQEILSTKVPSTISMHNIDPTSFYRMKDFIKDAICIFIIMPKDEACIIYDDIRKLNPTIKVVLLDAVVKMDYKNFDDINLLEVDVFNILNNNLTSLLPNIPRIAQGIGNNRGEIVEILVPPSSSFAYRVVKSIRQKNFKIVGIYRNGNFIYDCKDEVIFPSDRLLVVGGSETLMRLYDRVNSKVGVFPAPFGSDIVLLVDSSDNILSLARDAIYLHSHLQSNILHIVLLNAFKLHIRDYEILHQLRALSTTSSEKGVMVDINFYKTDINEILEKIPSLGLIIISNKIWSKRENKIKLSNLVVPLLVASGGRLQEISAISIIENKNTQDAITSVAFDLALQLKLSIDYYEFYTTASDDEGTIDDEVKTLLEVKQNCINLSKIINIDFNIKKSSANPVLLLGYGDLQILPLIKPCLKSFRILNFLKTDTYANSVAASSAMQLFIP